MKDVVKRLVLAGLGVQAKLNEKMDELVRAGEENPRQEAKKVREMLQRAEGDLSDLAKRMSKVSRDAFRGLKLSSRSEIDELTRQIQELAVKVARLELREKMGPTAPEDPAAEPGRGTTGEGPGRRTTGEGKDPSSRKR